MIFPERMDQVNGNSWVGLMIALDSGKIDCSSDFSCIFTYIGISFGILAWYARIWIDRADYRVFWAILSYRIVIFLHISTFKDRQSQSGAE